MGRQAAAAHCEDGARSRIMRAPLKAFTPPMYPQRLRRLAARLLGRCMLAWFALSIAVAAAAPLAAAQDMELICSSTGVVKLIVKGDDGSSAMGASHLDCPMCMPYAAPPPPIWQLSLPTLSPLFHALQPVPAARIAAITAAPLPARGPPVHL